MYTVHIIEIATGRETFHTFTDTAAVITFVNSVRNDFGRSVAIEVL